MPTYTTEHVKNLSTEKPFTFEISTEDLERLEYQKRLVGNGQSPTLGSLEDLIKSYEFSFFPAYEELLKIWFDNGFTTELITQILQDFGLDEVFIQKILEDDDFISEIRPWFEGITCDGERSSRTLRLVYEYTAAYYSTHPQPRTFFGI